MKGKIAQPFTAFDPELAAKTGTTTALVLGFIRYRTRRRGAVEEGGLRWAHASMADIAHAANVSKRTAKRVFAEALKTGLIKAMPDSSDSTGRLVACCQEVVERTAPGCWLAAQLAGDMGKPSSGRTAESSMKTDMENHVENQWETYGEDPGQDGGTTPRGVTPCHRGGDAMTPRGVTPCHRGGDTMTPPGGVTPCHPDTPSDLRFSDSPPPLATSTRNIGIEKEKRKRKKEKEKEQTMDTSTLSANTGSVPGKARPPHAAPPEAGQELVGSLVDGLAPAFYAGPAQARMQRERRFHPSPAEVDAFLEASGACGAGFDGHGFCAVMESRNWTTDDGFPIRNWQMAATQWVLMARVGQLSAHAARAA